MTTLAMERNTTLPFPTTFGFKTTSGFHISSTASAVGGKCPPAVLPLQELQKQQPLSLQEQLQCSPVQQQGVVAISPTPSVVVPPTPEATESASHVGWRGLLEISEHSGSSGVLGVKAPVLDGVKDDVQLEICCTAHTNPAIRRLVKAVIRGLKACQEPEKALDGMGGTYFFSNEAGKKAAILKPCDEEPLAPNNPKGYVGRALGDPGWKPTVRVGEAAMREVAAYLLDHDNWSRVPTSVLVRARHPVFCINNSSYAQHRGAATSTDSSTLEYADSSCAVADTDDTGSSRLPLKLGSLQEFVQHECDTTEMGPSRFSVRDVHRIGILDIRLFNTDRHAGNILVRTPRASMADLKNRIVDSQYELIPIDHGFCLPETLEAPYFEWLHWPQALKPFTDDELQYIRDLDIEKDKAILQQELPNLRPECHRILEVSTTLLQMCAAAGMTLYEIAFVMTRPFVDHDDEPSELEKACVHAKQCAKFLREQSEVLLEDGLDGSSSDEDAAVGLEIHGRTGPSRFAPIKEDFREEYQDMLFDLDELQQPVDVTDGARFAALAPSSPSRTPSPGSSPSSSLTEGHMEAGLCQDGCSVGSSQPMCVQAHLRPEPPVSRFLQQQQGVARSLHMPGAHMPWRKSSQQAIKGKAVAKRRTPQAYPPPVVTFAPGSLDGFFSDFDSALWVDFMVELRREIDEALVSGKWRQSASKDVSIAMSCPRF